MSNDKTNQNLNNQPPLQINQNLVRNLSNTLDSMLNTLKNSVPAFVLFGIFLIKQWFYDHPRNIEPVQSLPIERIILIISSIVALGYIIYKFLAHFQFPENRTTFYNFWNLFYWTIHCYILFVASLFTFLYLIPQDK